MTKMTKTLLFWVWVTTQITQALSQLNENFDSLGMGKALGTTGEAIITGSNSREIKQWSLENPFSLKFPDLLTASEVIYLQIGGANRETVYMAFQDGDIAKFEYSSTKGLQPLGAEHLSSILATPTSAQITDLKLVPESTYLLIATTTSSIFLVDFSSTTPQLSTTHVDSQSSVKFVDFIANTNFFVSASGTDTLGVREMVDLTFSVQYRTPATGSSISALETASKQEAILLGASNGVLVRLTTTSPNSEVARISFGPASPLKYLLLIPGSDYLAVAQDSTIRLVELISGGLQATTFSLSTFDSNPLISMALHPSKKTLVYSTLGGLGASFFTFDIPSAGTNLLKCHFSCDSNTNCEDLSSSGCRDCPAGFLLEKVGQSLVAGQMTDFGVCNRLCLQGQYLFKSNNTCQACHSDCQECNGGSNLKCTICAGGKYLSVENSCLSQCTVSSFPSTREFTPEPSSTIPDPASSGLYPVTIPVCEKCYPSCLECKGPGIEDCLSCKKNKYLNKDGRCLDYCYDGYYKETPPPLLTSDLGLNCLGCQPECATCRGGSQSDCLSCSNPEIFQLSIGNTCLDCSDPSNLNEKVCEMTRELTQIKETSWNYDMYSSASFELFFRNSSAKQKLFKKIPWNNYFEVSISNLIEGKDFQRRISYRHNMIIIDLNYTSNLDGKALDSSGRPKYILTVKPKIFFYDYYAPAHKSELVLAKTAASFPSEYSLEHGLFEKQHLKINKPLNGWLVELSDISGRVLFMTTEIVGWVGLFLCLFLLFFEADLSKPFVDFLRMVKPFSRFKYINIFYGPVVEIFLTNYQNLFSVVSNKRTDENQTYFIKTRGSLQHFYIPVFTFLSIPDKYFFYLLLVLLRMLKHRLEFYAGERARLKQLDSRIIAIIELIWVPIFCFLLFDVVFYVSHTLAHQSLIVHQSKNALFSIILAAILSICFGLELAYIFWLNWTKYRPWHKVKVAQGLARILIRDLYFSVEDFSMKQSIAEFKKNSSSYSDKLLDSLEKRLKMKTSEVLFFEYELKPEVLARSRLARMINLLSVIKVILLDPVYICIQVNPGAQISFLAAIQLIFTILVYIAGFKLKAYKKWYHFLFNVLYETMVLLYFLTGCIFLAIQPDSAATQLTLLLFLQLAVVCSLARFFIHIAIVLQQRFFKGKAYLMAKSQEDNQNKAAVDSVTERICNSPEYAQMILDKKAPLHPLKTMDEKKDPFLYGNNTISPRKIGTDRLLKRTPSNYSLIGSTKSKRLMAKDNEDFSASSKTRNPTQEIGMVPPKAGGDPFLSPTPNLKKFSNRKGASSKAFGKYPEAVVGSQANTNSQTATSSLDLKSVVSLGKQGLKDVKAFFPNMTPMLSKGSNKSPEKKSWISNFNLENKKRKPPGSAVLKKTKKNRKQSEDPSFLKNRQLSFNNLDEVQNVISNKPQIGVIQEEAEELQGSQLIKNEVKRPEIIFSPPRNFLNQGIPPPLNSPKQLSSERDNRNWDPNHENRKDEESSWLSGGNFPTKAPPQIIELKKFEESLPDSISDKSHKPGFNQADSGRKPTILSRRLAQKTSQGLANPNILSSTGKKASNSIQLAKPSEEGSKTRFKQGGDSPTSIAFMSVSVPKEDSLLPFSSHQDPQTANQFPEELVSPTKTVFRGLDDDDDFDEPQQTKRKKKNKKKSKRNRNQEEEI